MSIGVVVGRFQTPVLHIGHHAVINRAAERNDNLVIVVGVSPVPSTRKDPLDFATRASMLRDAYPYATIVPLMDHPSNEVWSRNLDRLIRSIHTFADVTLYGGRDSFLKVYSGSFVCEEVNELSNVSSTRLREESSNIHLSSDDFRNGVIYSVYNSFPRVNPTVDIAIIRDGQKNPTHKEVLLGRKPGEVKWRFPGGFVDKDESLEQAAIREAHEETGIVIDNPRYIGSFSLKDWRVTEGNAMVTSFFVATYPQGHAQAGDDLAEVSWVTMVPGIESYMNNDHKLLMETLLSRKAGVL